MPRPLQRARASIVACGAGAALAVAVLAPAGSPAGQATSAKAKPAKCPAGKRGERCRATQERKRRHRKKLRRANRKQKRPNVIVVETDDQNQSDIQFMPETLGVLGGRGTTFANSYVTDPLCCPSRATFLTGQYTHNHGVISTEFPYNYNALNHGNTLAVWLKRAKYRTAMVGKYLNGYGRNDGIPEPVPDSRERPPGWTQWLALTAGTEQRRYKYRINENGKVRPFRKGAKDYVTDVLNRMTNDLIREWAPHPKPFFIWFNPTAPHGESGTPLSSTRDPQPAPRHLGVVGNALAPRNPNFDEKDVSDKPELIRTKPRLGRQEIDDIDRRYRGRIESLLSVDEEVATIIKLLKKTRDLRKTYVIFTSDNGIQLGAHRAIFKDYLYEESTRVPLIIRGPRFPEGVVREQLVSNIDLAPTIVELTGVQPGIGMDGISLVALAETPAAGLGRDLLFESYFFDIFGIRRGDWTYNRYGNGDEELYDLRADPFQLQSRHDDPLALGLKQELRRRLAELRTCAGPTCQ